MIKVDDQSQNLKNHNRLNDFKEFTHQAVNTRAKKKIVYNNAKNIFNKLLSICYNDYINITDQEKDKVSEKYDPRNLLIKGYRFVESKKEDKEISKSQPEE